MAKTTARKCPNCGRNTLTKNGKRAGQQQWICKTSRGGRGNVVRDICYQTLHPDAPAQGHDGKPRTPRTFKRSITRSVIVVTAAQNGTPAHKGFMAALEQYCNHRSADLIAIPLRYKNPTSRWEAEKAESDEWWDPAIEPYLCDQRKSLNKNLVLIGDVKIQPTAVNPLTGFEGLTHGESGILGHTKLALKTVATPQGKMPKILTTTGAVTKPNYSQSKAGALGAFHHTLGAIVIEIVGSTFHMRQLGAKSDGSFYDLEWHYGEPFNKPVHELRPLALVMGDTHVDAIDPRVKEATFGKGGIVEALEPRELIWHDLMDGVSVSPHTRGNPFVDNARHFGGTASARQEFYDALRFVLEHTPKNAQSFIVPSNHNDWLHRWILATDWRLLDPINREFYLRTALTLNLASERLTPDEAERLDAFTLIAKEVLRTDAAKEAHWKNVHVLEYDESHLVGGIECGMHGHLGPNGARGSLRNLRRIGVKSITGHEHSPGIDEGAWRVGTNTALRRGYTKGPGSWLNTDCLVYPNGKRTLINIINGEWRA